jgi:hypothetical protein
MGEKTVAADSLPNTEDLRRMATDLIPITFNERWEAEDSISARHRLAAQSERDSAPAMRRTTKRHIAEVEERLGHTNTTA